MSSSPISDPFALLAALPDQQIDLGRAALLLAADEYPGLDVEAYVKRIDMLAAGVAERLPGNASPIVQVGVLTDYLFNQRRFRGNTDNYYDPRNSFLSDVLDRRTGIPITLSVLSIEVGRRVSVPLRGVGLPGHFVVCYDRPGTKLYFDPFKGGRLLTTDDCHEMALQALGGQCASFGHFLEPVSSRAVLIRMLNNLKMIHLYHNDTPRTIRVLDRILQLQPAATVEYRERGLIHLSAHHLHAALADLTTYLTHTPEAPDSSVIHERIEMIWAALRRD